MAMNEAQYRDQLAALLPRGVIWERAQDDDAVIGRLLSGFARTLSGTEVSAETLLKEADPRQATRLLTQWLDDWDVPGNCIRGLVGDLPPERLRQILVRKIQGVGLQSRAFFIQIAADMGFTAEIEERRSMRCTSRANDRLYSPKWESYWFFIVLSKGASQLERFTCRSRANEPLASWGNSGLECMLRAVCPAHTHLNFVYKG